MVVARGKKKSHEEFNGLQKVCGINKHINFCL